MRDRLLAPALLLLAGALWVGSSGRRSAPQVGGHLRAERDRQLRQPALCIHNRRAGSVRVILRGPVRRVLLVPAQENLRTLLPAGRYRLAVRAKGGWVVRPQQVRLVIGRRYHLEVSP